MKNFSQDEKILSFECTLFRFLINYMKFNNASFHDFGVSQEEENLRVLHAKSESGSLMIFAEVHLVSPFLFE